MDLLEIRGTITPYNPLNLSPIALPCEGINDAEEPTHEVARGYKGHKGASTTLPSNLPAPAPKIWRKKVR